MKTGSGKRHTLRVGAFYSAGNLPKTSQVEIDQHISDKICRSFQDQCLTLGDFNLRGYGNHTEDISKSRMFWQLCVVTEVEMCEDLGNSHHD